MRRGHDFRYYLCINGVAQNLTCPPTLVFNTVTNQCDLPDNVECSSVSVDYSA